MSSSEGVKPLSEREQRIEEDRAHWESSIEMVAHVSEILKGAAAETDDTKWSEARTFLMGLSGDGDSEENYRLWQKAREHWLEIFDDAFECITTGIRFNKILGRACRL